MHVSAIQPSQKFCGMKVGANLVQKLESAKCSSSFRYDYDKIETILKMIGANTKDNVDIVLEYSQKEGFYTKIAPKEYVPKIGGKKCQISASKEDISNYTEWINAWDSICKAPAVLRAYLSDYIEEIGF